MKKRERDVGDGEWRRDKLDGAGTVVGNKLPTGFSSRRLS